MKVKVSNISSGLLALPAPLSVTLAAGRGALLSLSEPEWKAVCASPAIARLIQTRMLSMAAVQEAPPAPKPVVAVEAPKPVAKEPKVAPVAPVEEPKAEEPVAPEPKVEPVEEPKAEEPAAPVEEPKAEEPEPKKKKKKN